MLQLVPEERRAWHAGQSYWAGETDMNSASIGIEIVHPGHIDPRPYPAAQIDAVIGACHATSARDAASRPSACWRIPTSRRAARRIPASSSPGRTLAAAGVGRVRRARARPAARRSNATMRARRSSRSAAALARLTATRSIETGVYDGDTATAVEAFQRHSAARVDGRADAETRDALSRLLERATVCE